MVKKEKKHIKIAGLIVSACLLFATIIPSGNASAFGTFSQRCAGPAGLISWLICPAVDALTEVMEGLYGIAKKQLDIPTTMLKDTSLKTVWGVTRDIANVIFVIFFLVVIFSQLTGLGIDNYGIKKVLPRIIVVAILINLSYIICELLIDLSNIVGGSIDTYLEGLSKDILADAGLTQTDAEYGLQLGSTIFISLTLGLGLTLGFIIALIIVLCHGIGALFTLLLVAIVRKISIIIIVAIAPLAFASFLLPNTERLFKKWLDWFKAVLLVYPICSVLVGGGALAGTVVKASIAGSQGEANDFEQLIAMIAPMIPLWFIPKVLKGSLASMGVLGKAVSDWRNRRAIGRKARARKALETAKSSAAYKGMTNSLKLKAVNSKTGKKLNNYLSSSDRGLIGKGLNNALGNTRMKLTQEKMNLERQKREINLWNDTSGSGKYLDSSGKITDDSIDSSTGRANQELTKGELYSRQMLSIGEAQISNAQIRMYQDLAGNQSRGQNAQDVGYALRSLNPERFAAAFRELLNQGGKEEALRALYDNASYANDEHMRPIVEREMAASGLSALKEFTKYRGANPNDNTMTFKRFMDRGKYAEYLKGKGETAFAGLDKDEYAFLAHVNSSSFRDSSGNSILTPEMIAKAAASLSSSDQAAKFDQVLSKIHLSNAEQQDVVNKLSFVQSATMFDSTRMALSSEVSGMATNIDRVRSRFSHQFNEMSAHKDQYAGIIGQMRDDDRRNYIA